MKTDQTNKEFIQGIRAEYMGIRDLPRKSLASSIQTLADDLYAKDSHFIFELIQNAEDNSYAPDVQPTLRFILREMEYQGQTRLCLRVENNETGFSKEHVKALCQVGQSTKKKNEGYIGEKGIGFKSVFRVTDCPQVHSNGFHFSLPEKEAESGLGYIVPTWINTPPASLRERETSIILPLKNDDHADSVADALQDVAPETILFLARLKVIEIKVEIRGISYEIVIEKRNNGTPIVELTHLRREKEDVALQSTRYWLTSKEFEKPTDVVFEKRKDILSREVFVAIPLGGDRPQAGKLFAYLPVWESTGLPFLVNADFLLVSSREGIHENEPWNIWLRDCIAPVYTDAFLSCVDDESLPIEEKAHVYASIPTQSHQLFLEPVIAEIQNRLRETECILTSSNAAPVIPECCRLVVRAWRTLLEEQESVPSPLGSDFFFVHSSISPRFDPALKTLGMNRLSEFDVAACLKDTTWVEQRPYDWIINLYRQLKRFENGIFEGLRIVPSVLFRAIQTDQQCGIEHPIYFRPSWEEARTLCGIPTWLHQARPVAFLPKEFQHLLDLQEDSKDLREWMTKSLRVYGFSADNFCVDILAYLENEKAMIGKTRLMEITRYLIAHAGVQFDWNNLPIILSDERRMTVGEARGMTWDGGENGSPVRIQALVVPENYDPERGWQHIWRTEEDRQHFLALDKAYSKFSKIFFQRLRVANYPGMASKVINENVHSCTDYERNALDRCHSWAASSRSRETSLHTWVLPKFPDPMSIECARAIVGWLDSLEIKYWNDDNLWKSGLKIQGIYQYHGQNKKYFDSPLLDYLRNSEWLPTTNGLLHPSLVFLSTKEAEEVLGDSVPYFEDDLPSELLDLLGVNTCITVDSLLKRLELCPTDPKMDPELPERIYRQLSSRLSYSHDHAAIQRFQCEPLIFVLSESASPRWLTASQCVWSDVSAIFGNDFAYLEKAYPKLKDFFVQTLGVKPEVDAECYARYWLKLQADADRQGKELRITVEKLYREIRKALGVKPPPRWLADFLEEARVYTQKYRFEERDAVLIPDDGDLKRLFEGKVEYAWRPSGDSFADWSDFYAALGLKRLSECVEVELVADIRTEPSVEGRFLTMEALQMIASWLREKESEVYARLVTDGVFNRLFGVQEVRSTEAVRVSYTICVGRQEIDEEEASIVFWDGRRSRLVLGPSDDSVEVKQAVAKQLARYILRGIRDHHGLENWVELILGARDTRRLKGNNWSVPREILQLCSGESAEPELPSISEVSSISPTTEALETTSSRTGRNICQGHPEDSDEPVKGVETSPSSNTEAQCEMPSTPQEIEVTHDTEPSEVPISKPVGGDSRETAFRTYEVMLRESLNQPGKTEIGEEWGRMGMDGVGDVPNLIRRGQKLAEGHIERIQDEPGADVRRHSTERTILEPPDPQVGHALLEWYGGRCQICGNTWPDRNGRPFFVTARLVERKHAKWLDDPANAVCLCAEHFAQWRHASKETCEEISDQVARIAIPSPSDSARPSICFKLLGKEVRVTYCEKHLLALKTLLDVSGQQSRLENAEEQM